MDYEYPTRGQTFTGEQNVGGADSLRLRLEAGITSLTTSRYAWEPQPDITVYELACSMRYLVTGRVDGLAGEPESVRRHWREVSDTARAVDEADRQRIAGKGAE